MPIAFHGACCLAPGPSVGQCRPPGLRRCLAGSPREISANMEATFDSRVHSGELVGNCLLAQRAFAKSRCKDRGVDENNQIWALEFSSLLVSGGHPSSRLPYMQRMGMGRLPLFDPQVSRRFQRQTSRKVGHWRELCGLQAVTRAGGRIVADSLPVARPTSSGCCPRLEALFAVGSCFSLGLPQGMSSKEKLLEEKP